MKYWLIKSEPDEFGLEHLKKQGETAWEGVRNFTARNFMMSMAVGDTVLFYHSSCEVPGAYGLAKVSKVAAPDQTQFDPKSPYFDPRATHAKPYWYCVSVVYKSTFEKPVTLSEMKSDAKLRDMMILKRARLSVSPVTPEEFEHILKLSK